MPATAVDQASIELITTFSEDVWNGRDYDRVSELVTEDFVQHGPVTGMEISGATELVENIRQYHEAFSDLSSTVDFAFSDESGEYVCGHFTNTGTHDGELMGISPTNVDGMINVIGIYRIDEGRIAESWILGDMFGLFNQLGAQPSANELSA